MMNQSQDMHIPVSPPEQGGEQEFANTELSLVHFRKDEAKTYDLIQNPDGHGEPFVDDELQIRSYAPLGERIKEDEEFRNFFLQTIQDDMSKPPENQQELGQYQEIGKEVSQEIPFMSAPGDDNPEIKKLAKMGHGGDSIMVLMPANLIYMLNLAHKGEENINAATNLPEFGGFFKKVFKEVGRAFSSNPVREVLRVGTTVAGAVLGGPLGAAAGSALGSAVTGRKPQDWLGQAAKAGALTWGAQALAPHIPGFGALGAGLSGMGVPGLAQMGQTMSGWAAPQAAAGAAGAAAGAPGWGRMTSHMSPTGQNLMPGGPQMGAPSGGGGILGGFGGGGGLGSMGAMLPLAASGITGLLAHKSDKEQYEHLRREREAWQRREEDKENRSREDMGYNRKLSPIDMKRQVNPRYGEPGEPYYIYGDDERQAFKKGGKAVVPKIWGDDSKKPPIEKKEFVKSGVLLRGSGDGVSDSIYTQVPQDTFIVNAYTVAMVGNGDSTAGAKRIQEWLEEKERKYGKSSLDYLKNITQHKKSVDVALSSGEIPIFPYHVMLIGNLNLETGHDLLKKFQENIKKHKSNHKGVLPPETKNLSYYIK